MPFPGEREFPSRPSLRYYTEEGPAGCDTLLVGFSAFSALGRPPAYNLIMTLRARPDLHRLWILDDIGPEVQGESLGCYYLGRDRGLEVADAVGELVASEAARHGVDPSRIVAFGSSKGATGALYHALRNGWGHAVAGGPQVHVGTYVIDQDPSVSAVAEYAAGGTGPEDKAYLDGIFPPVLAEASPDVDLRIHVGRGDPHWIRHVQPFLGYAEAAGIPAHVDLGAYETHRELAEHYPPYLLAQIADIAPPA